MNNISPKAICHSTEIAENAYVEAYAVVEANVKIESNCKIFPHSFISSNVEIQEGTSIGASSYIGPNVIIGKNTTIESHVKICGSSVKKIKIGSNVNIKTGSIIESDVEIGDRVTVGSASVVEANVPNYAFVKGHPASITSYSIERESPISLVDPEQLKFDKTFSLSTKGVTLHRLPFFADLRGSLNVYDFEQDLPFSPKRSFITYGVANDKVRGEHAHKTCKQFLICVSGSVSIVVYDNENMEEVNLKNPQFGLYIPPLTWGIQYKFTKNAVLLVFASEKYDKDEYIRDFDSFSKIVKS